MAFTTRKEMLQKVANKDEAAWHDFIEFYRPLIILRGRDLKLTDQELEELQQDVCLSVHKHGATSRYDPSKGRFRDYLRKIITNCAIEILGHRPNGEDLAIIINLPISEDKDTADEEWRKFIYEKALEELRSCCEPATYMAFELYVQRELPVTEVASIMSMSEDQVYQAKSRSVKRLKEIVARLEKQAESE